MATSVISARICRRRLSFTFPLLSQLVNTKLLTSSPNSTPPLRPPPPPYDTYRPHYRLALNSLAVLGAFSSRTFSTSFPDDDSEILGSDPLVLSELLNGNEPVAAGVTDGNDYIFPVQAVISMLDGFHDLTGLPWWMVIASSTLALRIIILPVLIFQLHKTQRLVQFLPGLPPPFPPPMSKRSFKAQYLLFEKERKAIGCPSLLWQLSFLTVQGGALWFQDLTALSHGWSGFIIPSLIAGLHCANVQTSFQKKLVGKAGGALALLADLYKGYLKFLAVPIFFIALAIPQGSLVYWIANSSLAITQQLTLRHPVILAKLGLQEDISQKQDSENSGAPEIVVLDSQELQDKNSSIKASEETNVPKTTSDSPEKWFRIPAENLSPKELTAFSVQIHAGGDREKAFLLLKLALDKDPEYVRALVLMGHLLLQKQSNAEATGYFQRAISKLTLAGQPTEVEDVDLLILASQWAGVAYERQGKRAEGFVHFERVANMEEPEDPACKAHYFNGLLLLASTLYDAGQKAEAAKYLRLVVAYKPTYRRFLDACEQDEDIANDLANSRREL
ncbi:ALBINO3-like protein 2, chloroplastic isoform X2 [Prosopis cineraria]|uniref:ALBINO3-like protein 2, chloroplastic isoform X2 n=1 Tax=Prosopis cineraria TaxID=364024 RepID=UPI00240FFAA8|nr:ALBINO3-like protein 2, chloroplastic isoform X2 [Prosopis cineraria]